MASSWAGLFPAGPPGAPATGLGQPARARGVGAVPEAGVCLSQAAPSAPFLHPRKEFNLPPNNGSSQRHNWFICWTRRAASLYAGIFVGGNVSG